MTGSNTKPSPARNQDSHARNTTLRTQYRELDGLDNAASIAAKDRILTSFLTANKGLPSYLLRSVRTRGYTPDQLDELQHCGMIGMLEAFMSWDPTIATFSTFARVYVVAAMQDQEQQFRDGRAHRRYNTELDLITRTREQLKSDGARYPTDAQIAEQTGIPVDRVTYLLRTAVSAISLTPTDIGQPDSGGTREQALAGDRLTGHGLVLTEQSPESDLVQSTVERQLRQALHAALRELPEDKRTLICAYYGIGLDETLSMTERANQIGVPAKHFRERTVRAEKALARILERGGVNELAHDVFH